RIQLLHTGEEVGNHGVYKRDLQTNEVTWTDGMIKTIGLRAEGLTAQNLMKRLQERVHPDDLHIHFTKIALIKKGIKISPFEYRVISETGGYRWVRHGIVVHKGKAIIGTIQCIDNEKKQRHQIQLAKMIEKGEEVGHLGFCVFNIQNGEFEASPNLWKLHGLTQGEVEQKNFIKRSLELIHPEDREIAWNMQNLLQQSLPWEEPQYRIIHPDGNVRWLRFKWEFFKAPHQLIGTAQDVTEKKQEELEKEQQQYILRAGEKVSQTASFIWNIETNAIIHTPQILDIYEFEDRECITDQNLHERIQGRLHPDDLKAIMSIMEQLTRDIQDINGDYRIILSDGCIKWLRMRLGERITPHMVVGSVQDVTAIKESEARLAQINSDLEQMVATVSHDLRAPLRHVLAYSDMLKKIAGPKLDF
ncbi:MAG: PAS domain-containing protein, partial [Bacteroidota bacterium]